MFLPHVHILTAKVANPSAFNSQRGVVTERDQRGILDQFLCLFFLTDCRIWTRSIRTPLLFASKKVVRIIDVFFVEAFVFWRYKEAPPRAIY